MIGVFDSGLGGLTVLRRVRAALPKHDFIYFADQAHVPYGDRTPSDLATLLKSNVDYLNAVGVDAIVMGCNTSCAIAAGSGWPASPAPILDLLDAAVTAVREAGVSSVAVLATAATVRTGAYARKLAAALPGVACQEIAAPALVPLVEAGECSGTRAREAVEEVCARFTRRPEAIVLACTHFPFLDAEFERALGSDVIRLDPADAQSRLAVRFAASHRLPGGTGLVRYVTNGELAPFRCSVEGLMGPLHQFEQVEKQQDRHQGEEAPGDHLRDRVRL